MHILSLLFSKSKGNEAQKIVLAGLLDLMRQTRHLIFGKQAFVWIFRLQIFWEFDAYAFLEHIPKLILWLAKVTR
jgi:hypothetical protein